MEYHEGVLAQRLRTISKAAVALDHSRDRRLAQAKKSLRTYISGIGDTMQRLNRGESMRYLALFHAYLDQIPVWRAIVPGKA